MLLVKEPGLRLILFPVICLFLLAMIIVDNWPLITNNRDSIIYTYARSFVKGEIGSGYGEGEIDDIPLAGLEPGDIILGGWPNCAYGRYSHAGLYLGNNQVLEGYVDYGLSIQPLGHYMNYTELCLLHINAKTDIKKKAVKYALQYKGQIFYPVAFKDDTRYWNCSKIIWKAYQEQGLNLDKLNDLWIAPESFIGSENVKILYQKGG